MKGKTVNQKEAPLHVIVVLQTYMVSPKAWSAFMQESGVNAEVCKIILRPICVELRSVEWGLWQSTGWNGVWGGGGGEI